MRRGRPTAQSGQLAVSKPTPEGSRGTSSDPFAALDSNDGAIRSQAVDDLQAKWPSLEEFSLAHDSGTKFEFGQSPVPDTKKESLNQRVAEVLADEAFGQARPSRSEAHTPSTTPLTKTTSLPATRSQPSLIHQPMPYRPQMVSTGIQTSPNPSPQPLRRVDVKDRPIWRVPANKSTPLSKNVDRPEPSVEAELPPRPEPASKSGLLQRHRTKSQAAMNLAVPGSTSKSPASTRPSMEGSRPSALDLRRFDQSFKICQR